MIVLTLIRMDKQYSRHDTYVGVMLLGTMRSAIKPGLIVNVVKLICVNKIFKVVGIYIVELMSCMRKVVNAHLVTLFYLSWS